jgi:hypothetical protein
MSNYIHNYSTKEELTNRVIEIEGLIKQENREAEEWETEELDEINEFLELANLSEDDNYYTENGGRVSVRRGIYGA